MLRNRQACRKESDFRKSLLKARPVSTGQIGVGLTSTGSDQRLRIHEWIRRHTGRVLFSAGLGTGELLRLAFGVGGWRYFGRRAAVKEWVRRHSASSIGTLKQLTASHRKRHQVPTGFFGVDVVDRNIRVGYESHLAIVNRRFPGILCPEPFLHALGKFKACGLYPITVNNLCGPQYFDLHKRSDLIDLYRTLFVQLSKRLHDFLLGLLVEAISSDFSATGKRENNKERKYC